MNKELPSTDDKKFWADADTKRIYRDTELPKVENKGIKRIGQYAVFGDCRVLLDWSKLDIQDGKLVERV